MIWCMLDSQQYLVCSRVLDYTTSLSPHMLFVGIVDAVLNGLLSILRFLLFTYIPRVGSYVALRDAKRGDTL